MPLQTFNRSLSCDVQAGERSQYPEFSNVLKAHGDAVARSFTGKPPADCAGETGNGHLHGNGRRFERKGRASTEQLLLSPMLMVPASVQHRRSTSSLVSALSSALRCSSHSEKTSKRGFSWRRCHSHETNISCEPCPTKHEEVGVVSSAARKDKLFKRVGKSNKEKMDGTKKAIGNCCIPASTSISTTVDMSSGYESMAAQGAEDSAPPFNPRTRNAFSDSTSEDSHGKETPRRCTDIKGKVCLV